MDELTQIATVLRSLGVRIESLGFYDDLPDGGSIARDPSHIYVTLNYRGKNILKKYTVNEVRTGLVTDARRPPTGPTGGKSLLPGILSPLIRK